MFKICLLGALSVGKTALFQQYLKAAFSDEYLSTVGVKISKKTVTVDGRPLALVLWDLEGEDDYDEVDLSYLRGASGFFLVADGTRGETLAVALKLRQAALERLGPMTPHVLLINKDDLKEEWEITAQTLEALEHNGFPIMRTSAKTAFNVDHAFGVLLKTMMDHRQ